MSVQTIKGSRQKNATGGYADYIPFGVDGEYTDMLSGLTLERELKLGGDHLASIGVDANGNTVVVEKYAKSSDTNDFYNVVTTIGGDEQGTVITSELHWIDSSGNDVTKNIKTVTIRDSASGTDITEVLS